MRRGTGAIALVALLGFPSLVLAGAGVPEVEVWAQARVTRILSPEMDRTPRVALQPQFEVLPGNRIVGLSAAGDLYDLRARKPLPAKAPARLSAFTADRGLLITIRDRQLGWYEDGEVVDRVELPQAGLQIVAGAKRRLFLYGQRGAGSVIYLLHEGRAGLMVEVPEGRISSLAAIGERLFFAVGNTIYTVASRQPPSVLFIAAGQPQVRSLAADPVSGFLYLSCGRAVYALRAGVAVSILRGLEGILRYSGNALFVLDAERASLIGLQGLEKLATAGGAQAAADAPAAGEFKE